MPYGFYISAEGAHAQSKRLEILAHNLANVDTAGFKRELAVFRARNAEATQRGEDYRGSGSINDLGGGVVVQETETDFSPGPLKQTGVKTDVAIRGEGFFAVKKDDEIFLSRAGNFHITARGELVTEYGGQNYAVLNDALTPIVINPQDPNWEITPTGAIRQAAGVQNLAIVKPESLGSLERIGQNVFKSSVEPQPVPPAERSVATGCLEGSAVQPATELIELIETSRAVEANVNLMQTQDQMLAGLFNRVLRS